MVTDPTTFTTDVAANALHVRGEDDTDGVGLELGLEDLFEMGLSDSEALYAFEYLRDLRKAMPGGSDDEITLQFSDQFSVRFTYEWNDTGDESELLLAPHIQKDYRGRPVSDWSIRSAVRRRRHVAAVILRVVFSRRRPPLVRCGVPIDRSHRCIRVWTCALT